MADHGLITAYLADLAASMRWHGQADDIVAETEDHLRSSVEELIADGADAEAAERLTLERFGDPTVVAKAFASARNGRLALPTRATRDGGVLGSISAGLWLAVPIVWLVGGWLYDRLDQGGPPDEVGTTTQLGVLGLMGATLFGAAGLLLASMFVLRDRHGGFGLPGVLGMGATVLGTMATVFGWLFAAWGSLLIGGTVLLSVELWRQDLAPKGAVLATGTGLAAGGLAWGLLRFLEIGSPDQHGDYPIATGIAWTIGSVIMAAGIHGLGRWLRSEVPVELGDPSHLAAAI